MEDRRRYRERVGVGRHVLHQRVEHPGKSGDREEDTSDIMQRHACVAGGACGAGGCRH